jgi:hypothetical protein
MIRATDLGTTAYNSIKKDKTKRYDQSSASFLILNRKIVFLDGHGQKSPTKKGEHIKN